MTVSSEEGLISAKPPLHCNYSYDHSDSAWKYLLKLYRWIKSFRLDFELHFSMFKIIGNLVIRNYITAHKLMVLDRNTWNYKIGYVHLLFWCLPKCQKEGFFDILERPSSFQHKIGECVLFSSSTSLIENYITVEKMFLIEEVIRARRMQSN